MNHLPNLFSPIKINQLEINNRIVLPPMATNFADSDGYVTDAVVAYYVERARGVLAILPLSTPLSVWMAGHFLPC